VKYDHWLSHYSEGRAACAAGTGDCPLCADLCAESNALCAALYTRGHRERAPRAGAARGEVMLCML